MIEKVGKDLIKIGVSQEHLEESIREVRNMTENRKEATERLRQLANSDFKNDEVEISVSYDICLSMLKCKICGCEFNAVKEKHYISRDNGKVGLATAFGINPEDTLYDTFDCPACGCQMPVQERKNKHSGNICWKGMWQMGRRETFDQAQEDGTGILSRLHFPRNKELVEKAECD